jgi:hypothetical protein
MRSNLKFAVVTVLALLTTSALAQETIGVIKRSNGHVRIERAGVQATPTAGTELHRGDRLITGPDGHVSVGMRRAAPLSVGPNAVVPLDRYATEERLIVSRPAPAILQGLASFLAVNRQR